MDNALASLASARGLLRCFAASARAGSTEAGREAAQDVASRSAQLRHERLKVERRLAFLEVGWVLREGQLRESAVEVLQSPLSRQEPVVALALDRWKGLQEVLLRATLKHHHTDVEGVGGRERSTSLPRPPTVADETFLQRWRPEVIEREHDSVPHVDRRGLGKTRGRAIRVERWIARAFDSIDPAFAGRRDLPRQSRLGRSIGGHRDGDELTGCLGFRRTAAQQARCHEPHCHSQGAYGVRGMAHRPTSSTSFGRRAKSLNSVVRRSAVRLTALGRRCSGHASLKLTLANGPGFAGRVSCVF